jgi:hypothetical protein
MEESAVNKSEDESDAEALARAYEKSRSAVPLHPRREALVGGHAVRIGRVFSDTRPVSVSACSRVAMRARSLGSSSPEGLAGVPAAPGLLQGCDSVGLASSVGFG